MGITHDDIEHRFAFHPATSQEKRDEHTSIRQTMRRAADEVIDRVPAGREQALAVTALEEAMMWANAGIARQRPAGDEQPVEPTAAGVRCRCNTPETSHLLGDPAYCRHKGWPAS